MSKSLSFSLVLSLLLLAAPVGAQQAVRSDVQRIVAATRDAIANRQPMAAPPTPTLDMAVVVSAGADFGLINDVDSLGRRIITGFQAFGGVRAFIGHDVYADDAFTLALGYEGSLGFGRWNLEARQSQDVLLTRHGIGGVARLGIVGIALSGGIAYVVEPVSGISSLGGNVLAQLAIFAGPVWICVPVGVDIWPDQDVVSQTIGLTLGGHTL